MRALKEFIRDVADLRRAGKEVSSKMDMLVKESVYLVWEHKNITIINDLIDVALVIKGMEAAALRRYYRQCVPFHYDKKSGYFTKLNSPIYDRLLESYEDFVESNIWHDFQSEKGEKPFIFNLEKLVAIVANKMEKAKETGQLSLDKLLELENQLVQVVEKEIKEIEELEELTDLLKLEVEKEIQRENIQPLTQVLAS